MTGKRWAYEDFAEGVSIELGTKLVRAEEIIEFAREFDPQPMHLDAGGRQGKHPRRPRRFRLAHMLHVHAPALRRDAA